MEEKILKLEQQNEELRRASEKEKSEVAKCQFVDLGLSVKWATCNVGANSPEEFGEYYMFDDAQKLSAVGERVPSDEDFQNLKNNCNWTWTTKNGVNGYKVTSRRNGNSIFLPAASFWDGPSISGIGTYGCYWSSSAHSSNYAEYLYFCSNDVYTSSYGHSDVNVSFDGYRGAALSVRLIQEVKEEFNY